MGAKQNISRRKRHSADEIYAFPLYKDKAGFDTKKSVVMVEYLDDEEVRIIAGMIPGMTGYYTDPDEGDEKKMAKHDRARELLEFAKDELSEYNPETSYYKSNSGNRSMRDIYVEVEEERKDEVILDMWRVLNEMKERQIEFLKEWEPDKYIKYDDLEEKVTEITKGTKLTKK